MSQPHDTLLKVLGEDLFTLVVTSAIPVVRATPLNLKPGAEAKARAFKLECADGTTVKGRRFSSTKPAELAAAYGRLLPAGPFPAVRAQRGSAMLIDWADGSPIDRANLTPQTAAEAGGIMAQVHRIAVPLRAGETVRGFPGHHSRRTLSERLEVLLARGLIDEGEARRMTDVVQVMAPPPRPGCLVHGDLAPANLIVTACGRLCVIDNETLDLHAPEYDLARSAYRWPMTTAKRTAFYEGYGCEAVVSSYLAHAAYWAVIIAVGSADYRLRQELPGAPEALGWLRRQWEEE